MTNEPVVGDGDPVGVAAEIIEHLLRATERALDIDNPRPSGLCRRGFAGGGMAGGSGDGIGTRSGLPLSAGFDLFGGLRRKPPE